MASRRMICAWRGEKHVPWLPRVCLPWPFAVPVAMAVVSSAVSAIPRGAPSSPKSHLLRPRWDFGRMISDNKRIECCCHVAYAARTVAGMLDHITLHVRDVGRSIAFYEHALAPLGYIVKAHHEPTLGFGVDDGTPHSDFYVSPLDDAALAPPPTHIAFLAPNREAVRGFHAAALAVGGRDNGAPGPRPYHPGYYSAFVLDPDGNNIEAVVDWAGWFENHR